MSDKPEKIRLCLCGVLAQNSAYKDTYYCSKCGVIHKCVTEYIRADLAKPSECTEGNQDCSCCPEHKDNWRNKKGDDHDR